MTDRPRAGRPMTSRPHRPGRPGPRHERSRFGWVTELIVLAVLLAPVTWGVAVGLDLPDWVRLPAKWLSLFLLVLVVVAVIASPFIHLGNKRKWRRFAAEGGRHGLSYTAEDRELPTRWSFDPFGNGRDPRARHILRGRIGNRPFVAFDYSVRDGGKSRSEYWVLMVALPARLPRLKISVPLEFTQSGVLPRRLDIDVEDDEFNRRFRVQSYDDSPAARKYAVDVLNPRAVEWMLSAEPLEWTIEEANLVTYRIGRMDPAKAPEDVPRLARVLAGVADNIPAFVYRQLSVR